MKNSVLVVGSVAYDSVITPSGTRENALGGSATYFSIAGSYFNSVSLVAVVGLDFLDRDLSLFKKKNVNTSGLQQVKGKTFRWKGSYNFNDLNQRETISTDLNVFADFKPNLNQTNQNSAYVSEKCATTPSSGSNNALHFASVCLSLVSKAKCK